MKLKVDLQNDAGHCSQNASLTISARCSPPFRQLAEFLGHMLAELAQFLQHLDYAAVDAVDGDELADLLAVVSHHRADTLIVFADETGGAAGRLVRQLVSALRQDGVDGVAQ